MLLQPDKSYLILDMIIWFEAHESRSHLHLLKIVKSTISTKIMMVNSRGFYPFGISSAGDSQMLDY